MDTVFSIKSVMFSICTSSRTDEEFAEVSQRLRELGRSGNWDGLVQVFSEHDTAEGRLESFFDRFIFTFTKKNVLHYAAQHNRSDFIDRLLSYFERRAVGHDPRRQRKYAALVDLKDSSREGKERTPLMVACASGSASAVSALLGHGASPLLVDRAWRTALHLAARHGHTRCVAALLDPSRKHHIKRGGKTSSLALAEMPVVQELSGMQASCGRYIDSRNGDFMSALQEATWFGHAGAADLLLEHAANLTIRTVRDYERVRTSAGLLHICAYRKHLNCAIVILNHAARRRQALRETGIQVTPRDFLDPRLMLDINYVPPLDMVASDNLVFAGILSHKVPLDTFLETGRVADLELTVGVKMSVKALCEAAAKKRRGDASAGREATATATEVPSGGAAQPSQAAAQAAPRRAGPINGLLERYSRLLPGFLSSGRRRGETMASAAGSPEGNGAPAAPVVQDGAPVQTTAAATASDPVPPAGPSTSPGAVSTPPQGPSAPRPSPVPPLALGPAVAPQAQAQNESSAELAAADPPPPASSRRAADSPSVDAGPSAAGLTLRSVMTRFRPLRLYRKHDVSRTIDRASVAAPLALDAGPSVTSLAPPNQEGAEAGDDSRRGSAGTEVDEDCDDTCNICFSNLADLRAQPCNHLLCSSCALEITKGALQPRVVLLPLSCPFCRQNVLSVRRASRGIDSLPSPVLGLPTIHSPSPAPLDAPLTPTSDAAGQAEALPVLALARRELTLRSNNGRPSNGGDAAAPSASSAAMETGVPPPSAPFAGPPRLHRSSAAATRVLPHPPSIPRLNFGRPQPHRDLDPIPQVPAPAMESQDRVRPRQGTKRLPPLISNPLFVANAPGADASRALIRDAMEDDEWEMAGGPSSANVYLGHTASPLVASN